MAVCLCRNLKSPIDHHSTINNESQIKITNQQLIASFHLTSQ
jgi:hypothetical protein